MGDTFEEIAQIADWINGVVENMKVRVLAIKFM